MRKRVAKPVSEKKFIRPMRKRLLIVMLAVTGMFGVVMARVVYINVNDGSRYQKRILTQKNYSSVSVPFKRGSILDCNGTVLAMSNKIYNLVIEPANIIQNEKERKATVEALKTYFDMTTEEIEEVLKNKDSFYEVVRKDLPYDKVKAFQDYCKTKEGADVVGYWFEEQYERVYPNNELGCHVLGFTTSGDEGLGGLEGYYNDILNGQNGRSYTYLATGNNLERKVEEPKNGNTLVTSIDIEIQRIVQQKSEEFLKIIGETKNISVLVMNPKNCEVLALYNSHQYDPNEAFDYNRIEYLFQSDAAKAGTDVKSYMATLSSDEKIDALEKVWRSFIVSDNFEPGSTYKVFTVSGAIEDGVLDGSETFYCDGHQQVEDWDINCHYIYGHGMETIPEALQNSCNDALMQIASMEGRTVFDKYQVLFGFGQCSNIDLLGEESESSLASLVYHEDTLNPVELATSSFGQGVSVTMMQLGTAFCSVINGGYYYQPHIVKQVLDDNGNLVTNYDKLLVKRTVSEETSRTMRNILYTVVEEGTGKKAGVEGYTIGGKTGTAEKWITGTNERSTGYVHSFIGFSPVEDPQVVIYCVVDEPKVETDITNAGGSILFNMIAEELLPYMNIYKTNPNEAVNDDTVESEMPTGSIMNSISDESTETTTGEEQTETTEASEETEAEDRTEEVTEEITEEITEESGASQE